jgi:hypothetical protein
LVTWGRQYVEGKSTTMDKDYDSLCKRLFRKNPKAFLSLFEQDATFLHLMPEELPPSPTVEDPKEEPERVDTLMMALIEALEVLVQIEWQSYNHYRMGDRFLDSSENTRGRREGEKGAQSRPSSSELGAD